MASMSSPEFSRASNIDKLHLRLNQFWDTVRLLKTDSPEEDWDKFRSFLNPECILYLNGISNKPAQGPDEAVADMKQLLSYWKLVERRVLSQGADLAGTTAMANMNNRLLIAGQEIEFPEMEAAEFDGYGRIVDYKLYCDPTPIMKILQG